MVCSVMDSVVCCRVALSCSEDSSVFVLMCGVWCVGVLVNEVSCKDCSGGK